MALLPQVRVVLGQPIVAQGTENVEIEGVFERDRAMRHVRRNAQHLALPDHHLATFQFELQRAFQNIGDLLAFVMVFRNNRAFRQEDLGHHGLFARNDLARDGGAQNFLFHFFPNVMFHVPHKYTGGGTAKQVIHRRSMETSQTGSRCSLFMLALSASVAFAQPPAPADQPAPRTDQNSLIAHAQLVEKAKQGGIDIYFEGDSITRRWGATDYPELLANWNRNFFGWNAADFGWGADRIQNILWRLQNGELDGVNPKVIVLQAGTNNVGNAPPPEGPDERAADVIRGIQAILRTMQQKAPRATIILTAIFPRNDNMAVMKTIDKINADLSKLVDGTKIRYLNINGKLADENGVLFEGMMNADKLHPAVMGYQVWADALKPIFTELLGPPAKTDHAPPATGDPSARNTK